MGGPKFVTYVCHVCVANPSICVTSPQPILCPLLIYCHRYYSEWTRWNKSYVCKYFSWLIWSVCMSYQFCKVFCEFNCIKYTDAGCIIALDICPQDSRLWEMKTVLWWIYQIVQLAFTIFMLVWRSNSRKGSGHRCCPREGRSLQGLCWPSPPPPPAPLCWSSWPSPPPPASLWPPTLWPSSYPLSPSSSLSFVSAGSGWSGKAWSLR